MAEKETCENKSRKRSRHWDDKETKSLICKWAEENIQERLKSCTRFVNIGFYRHTFIFLFSRSKKHMIIEILRILPNVLGVLLLRKLTYVYWSISYLTTLVLFAEELAFYLYIKHTVPSCLPPV